MKKVSIVGAIALWLLSDSLKGNAITQAPRASFEPPLPDASDTAFALEQFCIALLKDSVLQNQLKATNSENQSELIVELGKESGYFFTQEDVLAAMAVGVAIQGRYVYWNPLAAPFIASESERIIAPNSSIFLDSYLG